MIRCVPALLVLALATPQAALGEAPLKVIALTADWCARCHVLEPALARALEETPSGTVRYIDIDLTAMTASDEARRGLSAATEARLRLHKATWIWEKHKARTGLAFVIDADTGTALDCLTSDLSAREMAGRLKLAAATSRGMAKAGQVPAHADCAGRAG
ncbi:thioredoxin family protein [Henriciella sp.]|uniref:thioredoxin family protein n=1 Tax=Henriciella sp. TaxID=1968823 RepID=UPI00262D059B|nr:thioredoxin family protein [Henriciella sp.]